MLPQSSLWIGVPNNAAGATFSLASFMAAEQAEYYGTSVSMIEANYCGTLHVG
jgi:hypothetical protein